MTYSVTRVCVRVCLFVVCVCLFLCAGVVHACMFLCVCPLCSGGIATTMTLTEFEADELVVIRSRDLLLANASTYSLTLPAMSFFVSALAASPC